MTDRSGDEGVAPRGPLEEAVADLQRLQEVLQQVGRGEATANDATRALSDYLRDHGAALTATAGAVGEQARSQMLAELYRMRAQVMQKRSTGRWEASDEEDGREGRRNS